METMLALADLLEGWASRLRARAADIAETRERRRLAALPGPVGMWRCIRAEGWFGDYYTPGEIYPATRDEGCSTVRIRHGRGGCWAPYWCDFTNRFFYDRSELDFERIGPLTA